MAILPTGIGPVTGYNIERSLRFNSADSAYLNRTPGSASNRKTWTWSGWVKRSNLGTSVLFSGVSSGNDATILRFTSDQLQLQNFVAGSFNGNLITTAVYRDVSAWYHIVAVWDSANATSGDRMRLYVNGSEVTVFSTDSAPTQNTDGFINNTNGNYLGVDSGFNNQYFNGYITEVNFIDGQALTPSSFGETDAITGVWKPKAYTGTYGTNGFFLKFADNSGTTSTTLGKDSSGNGNNWTPNNFSVTAGVDNDSLVDTPTPYGIDTGAGGTVRGNYCTLNPLSTTAGTYTQGNLRYTGANAWRRSNGTLALSTGKWYWEVTLGNAPSSPRSSSSGWNGFGFGLSTVFNSTTDFSTTTDAVVLGDNGYYKNFSGSFTDGGTAFSSGDTLSIAVDLDANTYTFRRNNTQIVTGTIGGTAGRELVPIIVSYSATYGVMDCNFGQRPFTYTAPSGFKALCTQNLLTPAVVQGDDYFNTVTFTGDSTSNRTITTGLQSDFVWTKRRNDAYGNLLFDAIRGAGRTLRSQSTDIESNDGGFYVQQFNSTNFLIGATDNALNHSSGTYVAWVWNAGGSNATNTAGTVTSTVRANTTAGFSIVTWTGAAAGDTIGHGLGAAPSLIITKTRTDNTAQPWPVYHRSLGRGKYLTLNTSAAENSNYSTYWGNSEPSSTIFGTLTIAQGANNTGNMVAYCFAPVAGYSAFGSYTGNGNADGPFIYTGFRPRWVMHKRTDTGGVNQDWRIWDTARSPSNLSKIILLANTTNADIDDAAVGIDIVSNGFKLRNSDANVNTNGGTFIYAAFAEHPFKHSLAR